MNRTHRSTAVVIALVTALAVTGYSPSGHSEQETFDLEGDTLNVVHGNTTQPVTVSASPDLDREVLVTVST